MTNDNKSNIVEFTGETFVDISPDKILENNKGEMDICLVIGKNKDGSFHFAGSTSDTLTIIWLLECAKKFIMDEIPL